MTFIIKRLVKEIVSVITYECFCVEDNKMVLITEPQKQELLAQGHVFK